MKGTLVKFALVVLLSLALPLALGSAFSGSAASAPAAVYQIPPDILSPTHPETDTWYPGNDPVFTWSPTVHEPASLVPVADSLQLVAPYQAGASLFVTGSGLQRFIFGDPAYPVPAGSMSNYPDFPGYAGVVDATAGYLYDAWGAGGALSQFRVTDISDMSNPVPLGWWGGYDPGEILWPLKAFGIYVYVESSDGCMKIFNVDNPTSPQLEGCYPGGADLDISGGYTYVAGPTSFNIYDLFDTSSPVPVGSYAIGASSVAVSGSYAYLGGPNGLDIIDVSDPANPALARHYDQVPPGNWQLKLDGGYMYARYWPGYLFVYNLGDPTDPQYLGSFTTGQSSDMEVRGGIAYIAEGAAGLRAIDAYPCPMQYSYVLDGFPWTIPDAVPEGTDTQAAFTDLPDGEYFFHVASVEGSTVGPTSTRRVRIGATCGQSPLLSLGNPSPYWAGFADYLAGELTVDYDLANNGATDAFNVSLIFLSATRGVTLCATCTPTLTAGTIGQGQTQTVTQRYTVPPGVTAFLVQFTGSAEDICGNSYGYGPQPPP